MNNNIFVHFSTDQVNERKSQFIKTHSNTEINVSHFTGKIVYDVRNFKDANRDFVPPEMIESLRTSLDETIVLMFTNQLTKAGNLTMAFENVEHKSDAKRRTYVCKYYLFSKIFEFLTFYLNLCIVGRCITFNAPHHCVN